MRASSLHDLEATGWKPVGRDRLEAYPPMTLRALIREGCVPMPGVFNAAMGRMVERAGFPAVYISGAGLCNATAGVPDIGLLTLTEVAQLAGYIARAVKIPAIVDADTGFGGPENAARTIEEFERAGLAGCHHRRPGVSEALRTSGRQDFGLARRYEREDRRGCGGASRSEFSPHRAHGCARGGEF